MSSRFNDANIEEKRCCGFLKPCLVRIETYWTANDLGKSCGCSSFAHEKNSLHLNCCMNFSIFALSGRKTCANRKY